MTRATRPINSTAHDEQITDPKQERLLRCLATLGVMGEEALKASDTGTVFQRLVDVTYELLNDAVEAALFILVGNKLVCKAVAGKNIANMLGKTIPSNTGVMGQVLLSGRAVQIPKVSLPDLANLHPDDGAYKPLTMLIVPVKVQNVTIGLLEAAYLHDVSNPEDLLLINNAAQWVAVVFTVTHQFEEISRYVNEAQTITSISQGLSETTKLETLFQRIVEATQGLFSGSGQAVINRLVISAQALHPAVLGRDVLRSQSGLLVRVGRTITEQPSDGILSEQASMAETGGVSTQEASRLHSLLIAPILCGERRFGTVSVQSPIPAAFTDSDQQLLEILGVQAGLAIDRVLVYQAERARRERMEKLVEAAILFTHDRESDGKLDTILNTFAELTQATYACLALIEDGQVRPVRQKMTNMPGEEFASEITQIIWPFTKPDVNVLMMLDNAIAIPDFTNQTNWVFEHGMEWAGSGLLAPLRAGGQVLGILTALSEKEDDFGADLLTDIDSFATLAGNHIKTR